MTARSLALVGLALVACTGQDRVALELAGDFPTVREIDVILAAPQAYPRGQRRNGPAPGMTWQAAVANELVHYVAQRGETTAVMLGATDTVDQFRIQLASDDASSYLPIVIARNEGGEVVAIGVYNAEELFKIQDDGGVTPEISNQTGKLPIYKIQLEAVVPVAYSPDRPSVPVAGVMAVPCDGGPSGFVWRRAANQQLRVLLPIDSGSGSAEDRLSAPNLDCDEHSAGIAGLDRHHSGDRKDCDDTTATTYEGAEEQCNGVDDDCDGVPGMVLIDGCMNSCATNTALGLCDETQPILTKCARSVCAACTVPTTATASGEKTPCTARAHQLPVECVGQKCRLTLAYVDPRWSVKIGAGDQVTAGLGEPIEIDNIGHTPTNAVPLAIEASSATTFGANPDMTGELILSVQVLAATVAAPVAYHVALILEQPGLACTGLMVCGGN